MKPVLSPREAVELDRATQARGVTAEDLMERAGWAVARACADLTGGAYGRRAVVVCGKGNNGGDGFVAARHLARWGMRVVAIVLQDPAVSREPAAANLERLAETGVRVRRFDPATLGRELDRADVAVDAIFGTGFRGEPEDDWAEAIDGLNAAHVPVVAVDIPSGVDGTSAAVEGVAVRADLTVAFGAAKTGSVLLPGAEFAGDVRVVDIGFPDELIPTTTGLTEPADVVSILPGRATDAHKRASGTLVVVAGSRRMTGAVKLVARAACRVGAGYVIVAVPRSILADRADGAHGDRLRSAGGDRGGDGRAGRPRGGARGGPGCRRALARPRVDDGSRDEDLHPVAGPRVCRPVRPRRGRAQRLRR